VATLSAWRFDSTDGADRAADILIGLAERDDIVLLDAATVVWEAGKRKPRTRELFPDATGHGALGGGFWGLLFGLVFFVPLLGAAIGAATGAMAGSLTDVGIDDGFINRVRDQVTPGTSALFLLTSDAVVERVHDAFVDGPKGDLIHTDLSAEQESALREIFGD
jgi:uncharacterized membrane protein